jgi:threonine aldolase
VFNAAAHLELPVEEVVAKCDTVMFCLSKALGAPVGSMLVGPKEKIARGRLYRKRLGGGMRQAGILASAGLIALEQMPARVPEDHANARYLAGKLADMPGISIDSSRVQTNIVIFDISGTGMDSSCFSAELKKRGVLANGISPTKVRLVTHYDVPRELCEQAVGALEEITSMRSASALI